MKLATFVLAALLGTTSLAAADDLPGADSAEDYSDELDAGDYYAAPPGTFDEAPPPARQQQPQPQQQQQQQQQRGGQRGRRGAMLRQLLVQRFDRNGDGRLEGRERMQAARALRRLAKRFGQRRNMRQKLIQKYDLDHDGNLGPGELPPRLQQRLQRFDRNRDGWLDQRDRRR